jgi:hypothetical protein
MRASDFDASCDSRPSDNQDLDDMSNVGNTEEGAPPRFLYSIDPLRSEAQWSMNYDIVV